MCICEICSAHIIFFSCVFKMCGYRTRARVCDWGLARGGLLLAHDDLYLESLLKINPNILKDFKAFSCQQEIRITYGFKRKT